MRTGLTLVSEEKCGAINNVDPTAKLTAADIWINLVTYQR
jgi:hypothetical protein